MPDDRWHCSWCDYLHPVARMVEDHERVCPHRPDGSA